MKKYFIALEDTQAVAANLLDNNFTELDPCVSEFDENVRIFIDKSLETFYFLDDECLDHTKKLIENGDAFSIETTTLKEIEKWEY